MGKFYSFLFGAVVGFVLYHFASSYHVIRAETGMYMVPKTAQTLKLTYADIRGWGADDWLEQEHLSLFAAISESDDEKLKEGAIDAAVEDGMKQLFPSNEPE